MEGGGYLPHIIQTQKPRSTIFTIPKEGEER